MIAALRARFGRRARGDAPGPIVLTRADLERLRRDGQAPRPIASSFGDAAPANLRTYEVTERVCLALRVPRRIAAVLRRDRQARERHKAVRKYGDVALAPAGHPDYDVYDYAANELVGLLRYAEILVHRTEALVPDANDPIRLAAALIAGQLAGVGTDLAEAVCALRSALQERGLHLGTTEGA